MFGQCHSHYFTKHLLAIQMAHCQLSLVAVRQLYQSTVLFVVQDLHPLDITIDSCRQGESERESRRGRPRERREQREVEDREESITDRAGEMEHTKIKEGEV